MDTSIAQACMLAVVSRTPGITGPQLAAEVASLVPLIQFPQHIARLKKRGLIRTDKCEQSSRTNRIFLTALGEQEFAAVLDALKLAKKLTK